MKNFVENPIDTQLQAISDAIDDDGWPLSYKTKTSKTKRYEFDKRVDNDGDEFFDAEEDVLDDQEWEEKFTHSVTQEQLQGALKMMKFLKKFLMVKSKCFSQDESDLDEFDMEFESAESVEPQESEESQAICKIFPCFGRRLWVL